MLLKGENAFKGLKGFLGIVTILMLLILFKGLACLIRDGKAFKLQCKIYLKILY